MYTVVNCTHIVRPTLEDKLARGNCWIYNKWNDATGRSTGQYHPVPSQMLLRSRTEKSTLTGALQYMMKQNTANWQPHALNLNTWMGEICTVNVGWWQKTESIARLFYTTKMDEAKHQLQKKKKLTCCNFYTSWKTKQYPTNLAHFQVQVLFRSLLWRSCFTNF